MDQLGIEQIKLFAQIVNFVIIIFVLSKLLYKPIILSLEKRRNEIAEGLALTEKMRVEEEKIAATKIKLLDTARSEANAIIAEARKKAKEEADRIVNTATLETVTVIEKGKEEIAASKKDMEKEMRSHAINLAVAMAKRLLAASLTDSDKVKILDKHLKEIESIQISK